MVQLECDCNERCDAKINSYNAFIELYNFFEFSTQNNIFEEVTVKYPYTVSESHGNKIKYYATKWYRCKSCGCFWEFVYPDFPSNGYVRKFDYNNYTQIPYKWDGLII